MPIKAYRLNQQQIILEDTSASTLDGITGSTAEGFYTTFSTLSAGTRVLDLKTHLQRLYKPACELGLKPSVSEKILREQISFLAKENLPNESRIRLVLIKETGQVYVGVQTFHPLADSIYENGVHVITSQLVRQDPRIKDTAFITKSQEQRKLLSKNVFEILLTKDEKIYEGMTSNFYAVVNDKSVKLITARRGILLGVTRKTVLKLARGQGMSIEYRAPKLNEQFDEAFLTSSSRGVVPIVSIDNKPVGQGAVGGWSKSLREAYQVYIQERSEVINPE